jgi:glycosyltransferase involved in cell wall biosynthesis
MENDVLGAAADAKSSFASLSAGNRAFGVRTLPKSSLSMARPALCSPGPSLATSGPVAIALLTTYLSDYRVPLFKALAERHDTEVLCYGRGERYAPPWFRDLDAQLANAPFPARRLNGISEALDIGRHHHAVIAPFAGGALLPAAYAGARRHHKTFILWASVWAQPRSLAHAVALPATRHIYRHADAVIAYGEHVRRFVARVRGRDDDVFVAPQAVEPALFARHVDPSEIADFRTQHDLGEGPLVLYVGRLVAAKGALVLADAWPRVESDATLVLIGEGPAAAALRPLPRTRLIGPLPRAALPPAYAAAELALLPSIPTPRFREPWGLVCNEAMHQGRPVIGTTSVGAVAGRLVRHDETGWVVPPRDPVALAQAIDRVLGDGALRARLGAAAREAVRPYTYDAMLTAFERALRAD